MILIDNLTDAADQETILQMPDGSTGTLRLQYRAAAARWTFDFTHPNFPAGAVTGQGLCLHPNLLRQFKNLLGFGLAVASDDGLDPVNLTDLATGRVKLYLLDAADVAAAEVAFFGALA